MYAGDEHHGDDITSGPNLALALNNDLDANDENTHPCDDCGAEPCQPCRRTCTTTWI